MSVVDAIEQPLAQPFTSILQQINIDSIDSVPRLNNSDESKPVSDHLDETTQVDVHSQSLTQLPNNESGRLHPTVHSAVDFPLKDGVLLTVNLKEEKKNDRATGMWESIFDAQTTFKHYKGELEYTGYNLSSQPCAANPQCYTQPATIPNILPSSKSCSQIVNSGNRVVFDRKKRHQHSVFVNMGLQQNEKPKDTSENKEYDVHNHLPRLLLSTENIQSQATYWTQERLFYAGFACPLLWIYGSFKKNEIDSMWQKRCRYATLYFSIVLSIAIIVIVVRVNGTVGARQVQSDTIRAVINE
ncbi:hypothetical protein RMCBS344292_08341 [Rhizopus microsporus]|nr:hypothetical protein RMCBS344292_08341 [Rhizopus microsporus]